ncbi:MAG: hypothetical protein HFJ49_04040 [Clostridia bacterium]|nr:hypothetical protein [Clostridia bacterium]
MEYTNSEEKDFEENETSSNVNKLLYLEQQKNMIEEARKSIQKFREITQFQRQINTLNYDKWSQMDASTESLQEDVDWYVTEYIIPIQERQQELDKLENSLISIPEKQGVVGRIGKFFEKFIPGITKEGRQRRNIADRKQTIEGEINTYKTMIERNPFKIFGANKDIKSELVEKMDLSQLDKYSTMKNNNKNSLRPKNNVKSIADSIKSEDMTNLLASYPMLEDESGNLIGELVNNGIESFNRRVNQIVKENTQKKDELISQIDFEVQEGNSKDIIEDITQQIQGLMNNLTLEELEELHNKREQNELDDGLEN